jgi:hypothetical protein
VSNLNKWSNWYSNIKNLEAYGNTRSYKIGADYLSDCSKVEDWGCGKGWLRTLMPNNIEYVGLDGTHNKFVDKHVDLEEYKSSVDGVFMRHVLEHNYGWEKVLSNALKSFTKKMVLIIFTPWSNSDTKQIGFTDSVGVPDLSFSKKEIEKHFSHLHFEYLELKSPETFYGLEYVYLINKTAVKKI